MRDEAVTLFAAGYETTSNVLTWLWYALSQNPQVVDKLQAEVDTQLQGRAPTFDDLNNLPYSDWVLKEALRLYPSAWAISRQAVEDVVINDFLIKKDTVISLSPFALHRSERYWDEPNTFRPERFADEESMHKYQYLPFGSGPRVCVGNSFATMEMRLILATIMQQFTMQALSDAHPEFEPKLTLRPKGGMNLRIRQREHITELV